MLRRKNLLPLAKVALAILFCILSIYYYQQIKPHSRLDKICQTEERDIRIALSRSVVSEKTNVIFFWNIECGQFKSLVVFLILFSFFEILLIDLLTGLKLYVFCIYNMAFLFSPTFLLIDYLCLIGVVLIFILVSHCLIRIVLKLKKADAYYGYVPKYKILMAFLLTALAVLVTGGDKIFSIERHLFHLLKDSFLILALSFIVLNYLSIYLVGVIVGNKGNYFYFLGIPIKKISTNDIFLESNSSYVEYHTDKYQLAFKKSASSPPTSL